MSLKDRVAEAVGVLPHDADEAAIRGAVDEALVPLPPEPPLCTVVAVFDAQTIGGRKAPKMWVRMSAVAMDDVQWYSPLGWTTWAEICALGTPVVMVPQS